MTTKYRYKKNHNSSTSIRKFQHYELLITGMRHLYSNAVFVCYYTICDQNVLLLYTRQSKSTELQDKILEIFGRLHQTALWNKSFKNLPSHISNIVGESKDLKPGNWTEGTMCGSNVSECDGVEVVKNMSHTSNYIN